MMQFFILEVEFLDDVEVCGVFWVDVDFYLMQFVFCEVGVGCECYGCWCDVFVGELFVYLVFDCC